MLVTFRGSGVNSVSATRLHTLTISKKTFLRVENGFFEQFDKYKFSQNVVLNLVLSSTAITHQKGYIFTVNRQKGKSGNIIRQRI